MLSINTKAHTKTGLTKFAAVVILSLMAYAGSAIAQSLDFDLPTPMTDNRIEGVLPKGKPVAHFYSFTAGPGELMVSFSFYGDTSQWVGGQLTDAYGRAFTNLDAKDGEDKKSVSKVYIAPGTTLVGRYSVAKRQKLVLKVYTELYDTETPVKYRVRIEGGGGSFGGSTSSIAAPEDSQDMAVSAPTAARSMTAARPAARSTSRQRAIDLCTANYVQCTRMSILTKTGVGVCIVRRSICLKNAGV